MVDHRVTFSRRHPYATKSNRSYKVKTPGGKLTIHRLKKKSTGPKCGDCKCRLPGIKNMKSFEYKNCKKREKTVSARLRRLALRQVRPREGGAGRGKGRRARRRGRARVSERPPRRRAPPAVAVARRPPPPPSAGRRGPLFRRRATPSLAPRADRALTRVSRVARAPSPLPAAVREAARRARLLDRGAEDREEDAAREVEEGEEGWGQGEGIGLSRLSLPVFEPPAPRRAPLERRAGHRGRPSRAPAPAATRRTTRGAAAGRARGRLRLAGTARCACTPRACTALGHVRDASPPAPRAAPARRAADGLERRHLDRGAGRGAGAAARRAAAAAAAAAGRRRRAVGAAAPSAPPSRASRCFSSSFCDDHAASGRSP